MIVVMSFEEATTFKIDFKHQIKSLRYCWVWVVLSIIALVVNYILGWSHVDFHFIRYLVLFLFVFLLPVFYLHITYYFKNRSTTFKILDNQSRYFYSDKDKQLQFKEKDIEAIEQHIGIYYKNNIDFASRRPAFWTNYHYVKIQLKSGDYFFLTSLMIDYKCFPMHIYTSRFRFMPYLK